MSKKSIEIFADGVVIRIHNRRLRFIEKDGEIKILFQFADKDANTPACSHKSHKGKVRETFLQLSDEAMAHLVYGWIKYKESRHRKDVKVALIPNSASKHINPKAERGEF